MEKAIKISQYFKIINPTYKYIKITTHKSIRNYNTTSIAKSVAQTYKALDRRIHKENKKLIVEGKFKISYVIDIEKEEVNFYFIVPDLYLHLLLDKIKEIWNKATVEVVEGIRPLSNKAATYSLSYKKDDALSLHVDKKTNEPLNQILNVIEVMEEDDRVTIVYNFQPCRVDWKSKYDSCMKKIQCKQTLDKVDLNSYEYIKKTFFTILLTTVNSIFNVIDEFLGVKKANGESIFNAVLGVIEQQQELSSLTKAKKESNIIRTQIAVVSSSNNKHRQENNAIAICQAYHSVDGDNELVYKRQKRTHLFLDNYDIGTPGNFCSSDELKNFIQLPGKALVEEHNINHINVEETLLPSELQDGIKYLGDTTYKGTKRKAFLEDDYNIGNLPLVLVGAQGGGKTTYISNYTDNCIKSNEGLIVIDFIKNCELSTAIAVDTPADKLVVIDLGKEQNLQGLGYNEIKVYKNMSPFEKLNLASMQSQQVMSFVDSISTGDVLSSRMRRFLNSAATIVFSQGYNSIKNVIECLENHIKREKYVNSIPSELKEQLEDEINTLIELDDKDKEGAIVGTKGSKIEHILDRISLLREDFKLKYMYNKNLNDNINLVDCMEQGKTVLIKMREDDFPTKMAKNIMVTYWISKIWLASQIRGSLSDKPVRCNVVVDEVFQAPTCMKTLEYILPQSRKFGCKFIFSTQYVRQLDSIADVLEASGSSYMLLKGSLEDDFNHLKNKIRNYEYEDLRDMEQYSSLNLIYYSKGYSSFITKLPKPL